jgi:hypothetical protein
LEIQNGEGGNTNTINTLNSLNAINSLNLSSSFNPDLSTSNNSSKSKKKIEDKNKPKPKSSTTRPIQRPPPNNLLNIDQWKMTGVTNSNNKPTTNLNGNGGNIINTSNTIHATLNSVNSVNNLTLNNNGMNNLVSSQITSNNIHSSNNFNNMNIPPFTTQPVNATLNSVKRELVEKNSILIANTNMNTSIRNNNSVGISSNINNLAALVSNKSNSFNKLNDKENKRVTSNSCNVITNGNSNIKQDNVSDLMNISDDNVNININDAQDPFFDPKEELFDHTLPPEVMGGTPEFQKDEENLDMVINAVNVNTIGSFADKNKNSQNAFSPYDNKIQEERGVFNNVSNNITNISSSVIQSNLSSKNNEGAYSTKPRCNDINSLEKNISNIPNVTVSSTKISIPNVFINDSMSNNNNSNIKKTGTILNKSSALTSTVTNSNVIQGGNSDTVTNNISVNKTSTVGVSVSHSINNSTNVASTQKKKVNRIIDDEDEEDEKPMNTMKTDTPSNEDKNIGLTNPYSNVKEVSTSQSNVSITNSSNKIKISFADVNMGEILSPNDINNKSVKSARSSEKEKDREREKVMDTIKEDTNISINTNFNKLKILPPSDASSSIKKTTEKLENKNSTPINVTNSNILNNNVIEVDKKKLNPNLKNLIEHEKNSKNTSNINMSSNPSNSSKNIKMNTSNITPISSSLSQLVNSSKNNELPQGQRQRINLIKDKTQPINSNTAIPNIPTPL